MESARDFLDSIRDFVQNKAQAQARGRERLGMSSAMSKNDKTGWKHEDPKFQSMLFPTRNKLRLTNHSESGSRFLRADRQALQIRTGSFCQSMLSEIQESPSRARTCCWCCRSPIHWRTWYPNDAQNVPFCWCSWHEHHSRCSSNQGNHQRFEANQHACDHLRASKQTGPHRSTGGKGSN